MCVSLNPFKFDFCCEIFERHFGILGSALFSTQRSSVDRYMYIVHSSVYDRILGGDRRVRFIYIIMRRLLCCYDVVNSLKTQNFVGLNYRPHCYMFRRSLSSSDAPRSKTQFRLFEKMFLQYSALMQRYRGTLDPSVPELGELLKVTYFIYFQHVSSRRFYFVF